MQETSILLASPREPSGGSWLVNCLLELGVRVDIKPAIDRAWRGGKGTADASAVWQPAGEGRWRLHPRAEELKKWLPLLVRQETLSFRDDVRVLYVQDLPRPGLSADRTLLFLRDPRDAIHSLYRRVAPEMSLREFARFPQPETLLDAIDYWRLFVECWLARRDVLVYRFEDYKAGGVSLLARVAADLGLSVSNDDIERAALESTYEKARAAEELYRASHPGDEEIAMRAGRVGEWREADESLELSREIELRIGTLLRRLGYELEGAGEGGTEAWATSPIHLLAFFRGVDLPPPLLAAVRAVEPLSCPRLGQLLTLASSLDVDAIRRARLHPGDASVLLASLQEFAAAWAVHVSERLHAAAAQFEAGSAYHLARIRRLMAGRRGATPAE